MRNSPLSQSEHPQKRILVLEDDKSTSELIGLLFEMNGYQSMILPHTPDIIALVSSFSPDLILMDYLLPGETGGQLCAKIKENPNTCDIPVVIYSAYPRANTRKSCPKCDAFIQKPFDIDDLSATITRLLLESENLQYR